MKKVIIVLLLVIFCFLLVPHVVMAYSEKSYYGRQDNSHYTQPNGSVIGVGMIVLKKIYKI